MNLKYRYKIWKITKEIRKTREFYRRKLKELQRNSKEYEVLYSEYGAEYQSLDYERKSIITENLLSEADSLLLPVPERNEEKYWEFQTYGISPILSEKGINHLRAGIREEKKHYFEIASFVRDNVATFIAIGALVVSVWTVRIQVSQSRADLWHSLRREFDRELIKERKACGVAYFENKLDQKYGPVMDFFDVVAFLVHSNRMDKDIFHYTFSYYFYPYYKAAEKYITQERKKDPEVYEDIYEMFKEVPPEPTFKSQKDLDEFFQSEKELTE